MGYYLREATMECGCVVNYDIYESGCCDYCSSTEVDIDHIEYCNTHAG